MRIPTSVAEMLRTESQKNLSDVETDENGNGRKMKELLRLSVMLHYRPELYNEYERLLKQWERNNKESTGKPYKQCPLAEYERLFKIWERTQNKIKKELFWYEKEKAYVSKNKEVQEDFKKRLEEVRAVEELKREAAENLSKANSSSPKRDKDTEHQMNRRGSQNTH